MPQICPIYLIFHRLVQIVNEKEFEMAFELVNKLGNIATKNKAFSIFSKLKFLSIFLFFLSPFAIKVVEMNLLLISLTLKELFLHFYIHKMFQYLCNLRIEPSLQNRGHCILSVKCFLN